MTTLEEEVLDKGIPKLAVEALSAASRRASLAGHTLVFVKKGRLVRQGASGTEVLKVIPTRLKVLERMKKAKS